LLKTRKRPAQHANAPRRRPRIPSYTLNNVKQQTPKSPTVGTPALPRLSPLEPALGPASLRGDATF